MDYTWHGFVRDTNDALILIKACLNGTLKFCPRRLVRSEWSSIRRGSVYVYEERHSKIKRWTDGLVWSQSVTDGDFRIYKELEARSIPTRKIRKALQREAHCDLGLAASGERIREKCESRCHQRRYKQLPSMLEGESKQLMKKTLRVTLLDCVFHVIAYCGSTDIEESGSLLRPQHDVRLTGVNSLQELQTDRLSEHACPSAYFTRQEYASEQVDLHFALNQSGVLESIWPVGYPGTVQPNTSKLDVGTSSDDATWYHSNDHMSSSETIETFQFLQENLLLDSAVSDHLSLRRLDQNGV